MNNSKDDYKEIGKRISALARYGILGFSINHRNLWSHDWLEIICKMVENAESVIGKAICDSSIENLFFIRWFIGDKTPDFHVVTKDWEKLLDHPLNYNGVKFAIIGTAPIKKIKGDVVSRAHLVVDDCGKLSFFLVRWAKTEVRGICTCKSEHVGVRECLVIPQKENPQRFEKVFVSLAKKNPDFCHRIVYSGLDKVFLHIQEKEAEFKRLKQFMEIRGRINFSS
jgi:hypothetical protein